MAPLPVATDYRSEFSLDGRGWLLSHDRDGHCSRRGRLYAGLRRIEEAFGTPLPAELEDLAQIAIAAYCADRLAPKRRSTAPSAQSAGGRSIALNIPVHNP